MTGRVDIAIVGAGHGGAQAAIQLRQLKFEGTIALIGDESELPYERPPLSKEYLAGDKPFERLLIRPQGFWPERDITMMPGKRVVSIDAEAHRLGFADGATLDYGQMIWAAGGTPRMLPGTTRMRGLHSVRSRADVDRMLAELSEVRRVVVIGGGYIGLEAAAVLTKLGKQVVLIEALDRVLARVAGEPLSRFYEAEHRAHGVDLRTGAAIAAIEGEEAVTGVRLADGEVIAAEMVIVGIGILPEIAPLIEAGAEGGNGVRVDAQCRISLPDIFAIGDCALHANRFAGGADIRLESVQNANDQAGVAARNILGEAARYDAIPWFWSNQYDLKLQTVGLSIGYDETIVRGDPAERRFSVLYLKAGRVIALDCVNMVRDYVQGRTLVLAGNRPDAHALADATIPLKDLA